VNELPKSTGVVVINGLCITKGFHDRAKQKTKRRSHSMLLTMYIYITNYSKPNPQDMVGSKTQSLSGVTGADLGGGCRGATPPPLSLLR